MTEVVEPDASHGISDAAAIAAAVERAVAGNLATGGREARAPRASCSSATGSTCCSTRAPSSRTRCWPTRRPPTCPPTAWSPASGRIDGRPVCVVANDPTVKAGSWGARTVEKIVRSTEYALKHDAPDLLADRLGRRPHHRPGRALPRPSRRGAHLLQPGQAVGAGAPDLLPLRPVGRRWRLHPELLRHRDHGRGQRLACTWARPAWPRWSSASTPRSRRWAAPGMHATVSGCGDNLADDDADAIEQAKAWFSYFPQTWRERAAAVPGRRRRPGRSPPTSCPPRSATPTTCTTSSTRLVDAESFFELKPLFAPELVVGLGRLDGRPVGIVANNPASKGGVLFVDSADKAARFVWCCDAFNIPLVFLADVPGLHDRHPGRGPGDHPPRRQDGHGDLRGDRGQGLRGRCARPTAPACTPCPGPAFEPEATLALPTAKIAVMGPEAAVNAVFANKIAAIDDPDERDDVRRRASATSTRRTSTCCGWPRSWSSTPSSNRGTCGPS